MGIGEKIVGAVGIKATPYTKDFRHELERKLKVIEDNTHFTVNVDNARVDRNRLRRQIQQQLGNLNNNQVSFSGVITEESKRSVLKDVEDLVDQASRKTIKLNTNAATTAASAQLAWVSRDRFVNLIAKVDAGSVAAVGTTLAALSGLRVSGDILKDIKDWAKELDKTLPRLTAFTGGITSLTGAVFGLTGGLVGVGAGISHITPALLTLPGLILNSAASITGLVIAWKDAETRLESLKQDFKDLAQIIRDDYWASAQAPVERMVKTLMPQLRESFADLSRGMGDFTARISEAFERRLDNGELNKIFRGMSDGWRTLAAGADGFAGSIISLSQIAARYTPRIAGWLSKQAQSFSNWMEATATDGRMDAWMERAIDMMEALGDATKSTAGIFSGLYQAADAAGHGGLRGFADMLERWDEAVNSATFQTTLTSLFRGSQVAMQEFKAGFKELGYMVRDLAPQFERFLGSGGGFLGGMIGELSKALNNPQVERGLDALSQGFDDALSGMAKYLPKIGETFGNVLQLIGTGIGKLLPVATQVLAALSPIADELIGALIPAVNTLATMFGNLLTAVTPLIRGLAPMAPLLAGIWASFAGARVLTGISATFAGFAQNLALASYTSKTSGIPGFLGGLGGASSSAVSSLGRVTAFLGGPWGIAIGLGATALTGLYSALDGTKKSAAEVADTILQTGDAIRGLEAAAQGNRIREWFSGVDNTTYIRDMDTYIAKMREGKHSVHEMMSAQVDQAFVMWQSNRAYDNAVDAMTRYGEGLGNLAGRDFAAAQAAFQQQIAGLSETEKWYALVSDEMAPYLGQVEALASKYGIAAQESNILRLATGDLVFATNQATGETELISASLAKARSAADEARTGLEQLRAELGLMNGDQLGVEQSAINYASALDRMNIAATNAEASVTGTNSASLALRQSMLDAEGAITANADALAAAGRPADEVAAAYLRGRDAMAEMLVAQGQFASATEAHAWMDTTYGKGADLADMLYQVATAEQLVTDTEARAQITQFGGFETIEVLDAVTGAVHRIPVTKNTTLTSTDSASGTIWYVDGLQIADKYFTIFANYKESFAGTGSHAGWAGNDSRNGNLFSKGSKAFRSGGFQSGIYSSNSAIHKFAEKSLPWEAYISPAPGARGRNFNIWEEVGKRLDFFDRGGFVKQRNLGDYQIGVTGVNGGSKTVNLTVNNPVVQDLHKDTRDSVDLAEQTMGAF